MIAAALAMLSAVFGIAIGALIAIYANDIANGGAWRRSIVWMSGVWMLISIIGGVFAILEARANAQQIDDLQRAIEELSARLSPARNVLPENSGLALALGVGALAPVGLAARGQARFAWLLAAFVWAMVCVFYVVALYG